MVAAARVRHRAAVEQGLRDLDACFAHLGEGSLGGLGSDAGAEVEEEASGEAVRHRVQGRGSDAVVGGEAADVDSLDLVLAQPVGQRGAVVILALEAGVRRLVLALEEDRVERLRVEVWVERLAVGADLAVHRPRVDVVRFLGPVRAGVDVVVPGRHHQVVRRGLGILPGPVVQQHRDVAGHSGATVDGQRAALTEVVLHVHHDQCLLHGTGGYS